MLQVDGEYVYSKGNSNQCPSVALMFQIGEDASYRNEMILVHRMTEKVHGGTVALPFTQVLWRKIVRMHQLARRAHYFEFSRPLRTMDRLQQDAQFTLGGSSKISVAFRFPVDGQSWHGSGHYSVNCDWVPLDISSSNSKLSTSARGGSGNVASAFALLLSVSSLCLSVFGGTGFTIPRVYLLHQWRTFRIKVCVWDYTEELEF